MTHTPDICPYCELNTLPKDRVVCSECTQYLSDTEDPGKPDIVPTTTVKAPGLPVHRVSDDRDSAQINLAMDLEEYEDLKEAKLYEEDA